MKLCECGCGQEVKNRFVSGHNTQGSKQSKETILKRKQTMIEKYGTENAMEVENFKNKLKQTMMQRYGENHPSKCQQFQDKKKQTCQLHFGVDHPGQSKEVKEKIRNTCLQKYGVESINQVKNFKDKKKQSCLNHFGVDNFSKTFKGRQICRENFIKMIETQKLNGEPLTPRIGNLERECLNELQKWTSYSILRNDSVIGYFPDGYIKELSLVIEFDENWHKREFQKNKDNQKDQDYEQTKINVFRVSQEKWLNNKNEIIQNFIKLTR